MCFKPGRLTPSAHRVGQTKNVKVVRLVCKNSIEEQMMRICDQKLKLEEQLKDAEGLDLPCAEDESSPVEATEDELNCMQALREEWKNRHIVLE